MRIAYYSCLSFTDTDFPLVKRYQELGNKVLYIISMIPGYTKGGLFALKESFDDPKIYRAEELEEFNVYKDYFDLSNILVVYRTSKLTDIRNFRLYQRLVKIISEFKPDIFHTTSFLGISEFLLYRFKNKMVLTEHDPFMHSGKNKLKSEWKRRLVYSLAKKIVILNKKQREDFLTYYKLNPQKVFQNNISEIECLNYLSENRPYKENLPSKYILFFGYFSPYKGIDILCKAMTDIHKSHPDIKCIIAGRGKLNFDVSPYLKLDYIIFKNKFIETEELATLISNSMFTVCPYKDATQSGVVASSFALNKPVVATRVGGLPETVIDGEKGVIAEPNNVQSLIENINLLLDSPSDLNRMSDNIKSGKENSEESWDSIAKKYLEIYKTIS